METIMYFTRYLSASFLALCTVGILTLFNVYIGPSLIWQGRIAETFEVFMYSVFRAGPIAFALSFLIFFYGLGMLKAVFPFEKGIFTTALILLIMGLILDIVYLPKVRF